MTQGVFETHKLQCVVLADVAEKWRGEVRAGGACPKGKGRNWEEETSEGGGGNFLGGFFCRKQVSHHQRRDEEWGQGARKRNIKHGGIFAERIPVRAVLTSLTPNPYSSTPTWEKEF